jgi:hypothetical protein
VHDDDPDWDARVGAAVAMHDEVDLGIGGELLQQRCVPVHASSLCGRDAKRAATRR